VNPPPAPAPTRPPRARVLVFGCGNLLLSDEGFGVHFIRHLEAHYRWPDDVRLFDAGTLGILAAHELEQADGVLIVDVVAAEGPPGRVLRYSRSELRQQRLPVKLSPHQIGLQELLWVCELRGQCPADLSLWGVVPASFAPGDRLSPELDALLPRLAAELVDELCRRGHPIHSAS
jgi:hydrogenase maturation protease